MYVYYVRGSQLPLSHLPLLAFGDEVECYYRASRQWFGATIRQTLAPPPERDPPHPHPQSVTPRSPLAHHTLTPPESVRDKTVRED